MPKMCLFDASGYIHRAFHALPPLTTTKGEPVNAIFGFSRMISKVLKAEKPEYVAVCFDSKAKTFRHEAYQDYKGTRADIDENLIKQLPVAEELSRKWGLPSVKMDGYEADDLIATLAEQALQKNIDVLILSGDKDILQLVRPGLKVRDEMKGADYDDAKVFERYGLAPNQLVDYLSLMGDKVDNVIGVPGVGEKTAAKLLIENKSLEGIYANVEQNKPALKEKLVEYKEKVFGNRFLVTLKRDVPIGESLDSLQIRPPAPDFPELLKRLEFRMELFGAESAAAQTLNENKKRAVHIVQSEKELAALGEKLNFAKQISFDLETDGLNTHRCGIVGFSCAVAPDEAWYIPVGHKMLDAQHQLPWDKVKAVIVPPLENEGIPKWGQNLKFDCTILHRFGIQVQGLAFDTMLAAFCIDPSRMNFGLKDMAAELLEERMTRIDELMGRGKAANFAEVEIEKAAPYAGADAEVVVRLEKILSKKLDEAQVRSLFETVEMPLLPVLQRMEEAGVLVDTAYLTKIGGQFESDQKKLEKEVHALAGEEFVLNSPKQLGRILFEKLKLPALKKTKTGYSTDEETLTKLAKNHPICEKIIGYRQMAKLKSTYVDGLLEEADPLTGRVHTSFNQTGAATGRLSSTEPNLQNIPIRSEHGRMIRKAFIAAPGHQLLSADYSQIDLRALAHVSEDPVLITTFMQGGDIHTATAAQVFHVKPEEVTTEMRRRAKAINFGVVYGQQAYGLSQGLGIPLDEAQSFIAKYFERYAGVKTWIEKTLADARKVGFVTTVLGRRRLVPEINSPNAQIRGFADRIAMNTPIQGSSADIIKVAMIKIDDEIRRKNLRMKMLVQVHDELLFEVPEDEMAAAKALVRSCMEHALEWRVPVVADMKVGANWNEMVKQ